MRNGEEAFSLYRRHLYAGGIAATATARGRDPAGVDLDPGHWRYRSPPDERMIVSARCHPAVPRHGWLCLGWIVPLHQTVGIMPISLMFAGGLCYSGGLLFYRWERLPFSTPMWHLCVVAGSASFFLAISRVLQI